jgi:hypothetical protein
VASNHGARTQAISAVIKTEYKYTCNHGGGIFLTWAGQAAKSTRDHSKALIVAESFYCIFLSMLGEFGGITSALDLLTGRRTSTHVQVDTSSTVYGPGVV